MSAPLNHSITSSRKFVPVLLELHLDNFLVMAPLRPPPETSPNKKRKRRSPRTKARLLPNSRSDPPGPLDERENSDEELHLHGKQPRLHAEKTPTPQEARHIVRRGLLALRRSDLFQCGLYLGDCRDP